MTYWAQKGLWVPMLICFYCNIQDKYHDEDLKTFLDATKDKYRSVTVIGASDKMTEAAARNWAMYVSVK